MRALDKIFQIILGVVLFFISAAALVFLDFSTEHGLIYPEVLYCIVFQRVS